MTRPERTSARRGPASALHSLMVRSNLGKDPPMSTRDFDDERWPIVVGVDGSGAA